MGGAEGREGWLDGWMDGWMDGWTDGRLVGWVGRRLIESLRGYNGFSFFFFRALLILVSLASTLPLLGYVMRNSKNNNNNYYYIPPLFLSLSLYFSFSCLWAVYTRTLSRAATRDGKKGKGGTR
ncbi:uncharacterized protein K452DRAFT_31512 [Aplosporella prunicola CBS 121167]|uniref:Uncharacterized protein n=1 Tax=Aplosporella prunicola CBS 121167 TaxID=1176127 RepID=A0A6A6BC81_9PEZI|nr:uncharacterized protein K452DRAFT_31512 [Aplosporella prunicola CBS 121167]KAF2141656.1 hypothetical protein K452DRAFT_31512 [Aplosporella prunicola CBS 121167]